MRLTSFLHTAILVSNLEKSAHFYGSVLGLKKVERILKYPGLWYEIGNYQIHLILDEQIVLTQQNPTSWGRNPHIALGVADLAVAREKLEIEGYPVKMSGSGRPALFTQDPDGNIIEIAQSN